MCHDAVRTLSKFKLARASSDRQAICFGEKVGFRNPAFSVGDKLCMRTTCSVSEAMYAIFAINIALTVLLKHLSSCAFGTAFRKSLSIDRLLLSILFFTTSIALVFR